MSNCLFDDAEACGCQKWYCRLCNPPSVEAIMKNALEHAADWRIKADEWFGQQYSGCRFTSEDVTDAVGFPAGDHGMHRNNAVGAWVRNLAKQSKIRRVAPVPSRNNASHGATIWLWMKI